MKYVLFNELSNNGKGKVGVDDLVKTFGDAEYEEVSLINLDVKEFEKKLTSKDELYLVGGDGTLNHFVNDFDCDNLKPKAFIYSAGTGNDFLNDVAPNEKLVQINDYIKNLPTVYVNDLKRKFINGVGYGIDGYCCEVADQMKEKTDKDINYARIAIKGILFKFKKRKAVIKVDGIEYHFNHVWLAASMNGKCYGGGMQVAPKQHRLEKEKRLTLCVFKGRSKLGTLMVFPKIFEGKLENYPKHVTYLTGKEIEVSFDNPCALQIDGETVLNVSSYKAVA